MTPPRLTMRRASKDDIPHVAALMAEASRWLASLGSDQWQYPARMDRIVASVDVGTLWIALHRGQVVGTVTVDTFADPEFWRAEDRPESALYVHRMIVARSTAGRGIGTALLDWAADRAADAGYPWLRLDAWATNKALHAYYLSHGWTHIRTVRLPHRGSGALFQRRTGAGADRPSSRVRSEYSSASCRRHWRSVGSMTAPTAPNAGVWLSRYEYYSSGRDDTLVGLHHVVLQHADRLTVRSLPGSADSELTMDLTVDGPVLTGTWVEQTSENGYYRGARYHGAIQLLMEPTGRRMTGKWVGFDKDLEVNSGPWELTFEDASTNKATLDRYNRLPAR